MRKEEIVTAVIESMHRVINREGQRLTTFKFPEISSIRTGDFNDDPSFSGSHLMSFLSSSDFDNFLNERFRGLNDFDLKDEIIESARRLRGFYGSFLFRNEVAVKRIQTIVKLLLDQSKELVDYAEIDARTDYWLQFVVFMIAEVLDSPNESGRTLRVVLLDGRFFRPPVEAASPPKAVPLGWLFTPIVFFALGFLIIFLIYLLIR